MRIILPKINIEGEKELNHLTKPLVKRRAPIAPVRGHGLMSTKWKEWLLLTIINGQLLHLSKELKERQKHRIEL